MIRYLKGGCRAPDRGRHNRSARGDIHSNLHLPA